jgi:hypothetical protein
MSILKNNFVVGITAGLVATIIAPLIVSAARKAGRPLAKSLIKGGIIVYERGREAVAGGGEVMEDMMAEVRAEMMEKNFAHASAGSAGMHQQHDEASSYGGNGSGQYNANHDQPSSSSQERTVQ